MTATVRTLRACACALLLAGGPARAARFIVGGAADTVAVTPGETFTLDLVVREAGPSFNGFDLDLRFDATRLTNLPLSPITQQRGALMTSACLLNAPFHIFAPASDSLVCSMVIMCNGVSVTGPGTLYRVRFAAAFVNEWTTLTFGAGTAFYMGGPHVDTLVTRPIAIKIGSPAVLDAGTAPSRVAAPELDAVSPNPSRRPVVVDVSFRLPRADDAELALLDVQGRRVAGLPRAHCEAGPHRVAFGLPALAPGHYTLVLRTGTGATRTQSCVILP